MCGEGLGHPDGNVVLVPEKNLNEFSSSSGADDEMRAL